jgi:hypothetical protein
VPTPSTWAVGVSAPSYTNPYQALEESIPSPGGGSGSLIFGQAGGEVIPASRRKGGNWTEIMDWQQSPAIWILAAVLIAVGVLHLGAGLKLGPAHVMAEA